MLYTKRKERTTSGEIQQNNSFQEIPLIQLSITRTVQGSIIEEISVVGRDYNCINAAKLFDKCLGSLKFVLKKMEKNG